MVQEIFLKTIYHCVSLIAINYFINLFQLTTLLHPMCIFWHVTNCGKKGRTLIVLPGPMLQEVKIWTLHPCWINFRLYNMLNDIFHPGVTHNAEKLADHMHQYYNQITKAVLEGNEQLRKVGDDTWSNIS